jgi:hypothetical protein
MGMGIPLRFIPAGMGIGKKYSPQAFVGIPAGKNFRRGDEELFPAGNSPLPSLAVYRVLYVAIPSCVRCTAYYMWVLSI